MRAAVVVGEDERVSCMRNAAGRPEKVSLVETGDRPSNSTNSLDGVLDGDATTKDSRHKDHRRINRGTTRKVLGT